MNKEVPLVHERKIKHKDIYARQSKYNPISQTYTEPDREQHTSLRDRQHMAEQRVNNFNRQLENECKYNVLSFYSKADPSKNMARIEAPKECNVKSQMSGYPFNIVNHHALKGKEEEVRKIDEHNVVIPETKIVRDFDVVTNNYYQDHDGRTNQEFQTFRNEKLALLDKKRTVNTLTCQYYDKAKETQTLQDLQKSHVEKQRKQEAMFPVNYKFSEGFVYDIVNPQNILDQQRREKYDNHFDRKKRYKMKYELEEVYHQKDFRSQDIQERKRINKISQNRQIEELEKGYDMISQEPYTKEDLYRHLEANDLRTVYNISDQYRKDGQNQKLDHEIPDHSRNPQEFQTISNEQGHVQEKRVTDNNRVKTQNFDEVKSETIQDHTIALQPSDSIDKIVKEESLNEKTYSLTNLNTQSTNFVRPERNDLRKTYINKFGKQNYTPTNYDLKTNHIKEIDDFNKDVDFYKELYTEVKTTQPEKDKTMRKIPPKPEGKHMTDNFNKKVDTMDDLFGKRENLNQTEFRNEIFLNLNILTRPAGPSTVSPKNTKKRHSSLMASNKKYEKKNSTLNENDVNKIPQKKNLQVENLNRSNAFQYKENQPKSSKN